MTHFSKKFALPAPNMNLLETMKAHFHISPDEEHILNSNFEEFVIVLGEWIGGDEKLFKFLGNSGNSRKCASKPGKIGFWFYELIGRVSYSNTISNSNCCIAIYWKALFVEPQTSQNRKTIRRKTADY